MSMTYNHLSYSWNCIYAEFFHYISRSCEASYLKELTTISTHFLLGVYNCCYNKNHFLTGLTVNKVAINLEQNGNKEQ
jgi:hypothetical protein